MHIPSLEYSNSLGYKAIISLGLVIRGCYVIVLPDSDFLYGVPVFAIIDLAPTCFGFDWYLTRSLTLRRNQEREVAKSRRSNTKPNNYT